MNVLGVGLKMFKRLLPVDFLGIIVDLPDVCVELIVELLGGGEGVVGILQLIVGNQIPFVRTVPWFRQEDGGRFWTNPLR